MKKRTRTTGRIRALRLTLGRGSEARARSRLERRTVERPAEEPNITTLVPEQQFDALLTLLDQPPEVSDDLRREVAQRRWR